MTAEHLVAIALKVGRPKDIARILQFIQEKAINGAKLKRVLSRHGLSSQWRAFEKKYLPQ
ncbi:MAG: hypothetical protein JWO13_616 [Acidobacteriales bacterium]|nr:hypothetical protein [Terriglobales bacterium]